MTPDQPRDRHRGEDTPGRAEPWAGVDAGERPSERGCDLPSPAAVATRRRADRAGPRPRAED